MDLNRSSVAKGHIHNETEINSTPLYTYEIFISKNWKISKKNWKIGKANGVRSVVSIRLG